MKKTNWFHVRADELKQGQWFAVDAFSDRAAFIKEIQITDGRVHIHSQVYKDELRYFIFHRAELLWYVVTAVDR